ncbi:MAG: class I SAM-dependent RNA methyltransferase [Spirochaetes bacterium]|nr:class I SAM-dependent RNA methyltransferase [Spirochaetota bacterium]
MIVTVEKIVHGAYGFARGEGGVCLVPYAVVGDTLDVEPDTRGTVQYGRIKEIKVPSALRKKPVCARFGLCGGCDFENIEYAFELEVKKGILTEDLKRIGGLRDLPETAVVCGRPYHYRNHAQFKVDGSGAVGFFRQGSREVIGIPSSGCLLLDHSINGYVSGIVAGPTLPRGGFRVRAGDNGMVFKKGVSGRPDDRYAVYRAGDMEFRVGIDDFFQVNSAILDAWLQAVAAALYPKEDDTVLDLYSGCGLISLFIARKVKEVIGVEIVRRAVSDAFYNAAANGIGNVTFKRRDVSRGIKEGVYGAKVIVDPPRAGLSRVLIDDIVRMEPSRLVYVSCNTATFARDVGRFTENGYRLRKLTMVDMFPRTKHLEVVACLVPDPGVDGVDGGGN